MRAQTTDDKATEQQAEGGRRRPRWRAGTPEYVFYFMPDGKSGERVSKGKCPADDDPELAIEESSQCPPGLYRIEMRKGGEISGKVYFYTKEEDDAAAVEVVGEEDDAGAELDDIDARIAKAVARVLDERDRRAGASTPQPDPLAIAREVDELAERRATRDRALRASLIAEIEARRPKENPAPREDLSDRQRLELAVIKETGAIPAIFRELRDAMGTVERVDEPRGWTDKVLDFAKEFVPYVGPVAGPVIGRRLISLLGKVDDAALIQAAGVQPAQQPQEQQPAQPTDAPQPEATTTPSAEGEAPAAITFESVLEGLVTDLQEGNDPEEAIGDIAKLVTAEPDYLPVVGKLMSQTNEQLIQLLGQAKGIDLSLLLNSGKYLNGLRAGLKKRIRLPGLSDAEATAKESDAPTVAPAASKNGHKGEAARAS